VTSTHLIRLLTTAALLVALPEVSHAQLELSLPAGGPVARERLQGGTQADPLQLSISDAVRRALEHNLGVLLSAHAADSEAGSRAVARSELLPRVDGSVAWSRRQTNLEAFGFPVSERFPGIPPVVGPYNVFDARLFLTQRLVDLSAIEDLRAAQHSLAAARHDVRGARALVVLATANLYLQTMAHEARVESAGAQLQTAEALHRQALDLKESGLVPGIDVLRAEVRLNTDRQRLTVATNELEKSKLRLARLIGVPVGQPLVLTQDIPAVQMPEITLEQALARAYDSRSDYQAALERVEEAAAAGRAARNELLPSARLSADYGAIGLSADTALATFNVTGTLDVPIFSGGSVRGRMAEADADLRDRQAEADDVRAGIDYDVRAAFLDLAATEEELQTATRARDLAGQQLVQAGDRFAAGVASNIEVVEAQEAVATASEQLITAQYGFSLAKGALVRSIGASDEAVVQVLGGGVIR